MELLTTPLNSVQSGDLNLSPEDLPFDAPAFVQADTPTVLFRSRHCLSRQQGTPTAVQPSTSTERPGHITCPIDITDVCDSEDEEIALAVEESILSAQIQAASDAQEFNLSAILKQFQDDAVSEETRSTIIVSRRNVLKSAFAAMSRPSFSSRGRLYVKFSGEMGEDYGGPRREFFRLAIQELLQSNLFDGPENSRYFSHNVELLQKQHYFLAGQLVALSIAHDGPGSICLNEHLFDFMTENDSTTFDCLHMLPEDIQKIITELRDISTDCDRERFLLSHGDWLIDQGLVNIYRMTVASKEEYALLLQKQFICFRTSAEIAQFIKGMDSLKLWELVKANAAGFKTLFCKTPDKLVKEKFESLCQYIQSDEGSNNRMAEEVTIYSWELFLQDIEDETVPVTYGELLMFITGADNVPVLGFNRKIEISFFTPEPGVRRLPYVSTCGLQIFLPRGMENTKDLSDILVRALKDSQGFHKI